MMIIAVNIPGFAGSTYRRSLYSQEKICSSTRVQRRPCCIQQRAHPIDRVVGLFTSINAGRSSACASSRRRPRHFGNSFSIRSLRVSASISAAGASEQVLSLSPSRDPPRHSLTQAPSGRGLLSNLRATAASECPKPATICATSALKCGPTDDMSRACTVLAHPEIRFPRSLPTSLASG